MKTPQKRFVAIAPNYWAVGETEAEALREVMKQGAHAGQPFNLYEVEGEFEISQVDGTLYTGKDKCRKVRDGKLPKRP